MLAQESLKALGGLGLLSFGGKFLLRRVFEVCLFIKTIKKSLRLFFFTCINIFPPELKLERIFNSGCCRSKEFRGFCCALLVDGRWDITYNTKVGFQ